MISNQKSKTVLSFKNMWARMAMCSAGGISEKTAAELRTSLVVGLIREDDASRCLEVSSDSGF